MHSTLGFRGKYQQSKTVLTVTRFMSDIEQCAERPLAQSTGPRASPGPGPGSAERPRPMASCHDCRGQTRIEYEFQVRIASCTSATSPSSPNHATDHCASDCSGQVAARSRRRRRTRCDPGRLFRVPPQVTSQVVTSTGRLYRDLAA